MILARPLITPMCAVDITQSHLCRQKLSAIGGPTVNGGGTDPLIPPVVMPLQPSVVKFAFCDLNIIGVE